MEELAQKIFRLRKYLRIIEELSPDCESKFDDEIYRGALLHYLYLMADSCIAIAEMIIRYKKLRPPQSYADAFDILGENGLLDREFAYSFAKIAGFRNFLAHDYEEVDKKRICSDALKKIPDVERFVKEIEKIL